MTKYKKEIGHKYDEIALFVITKACVILKSSSKINIMELRKFWVKGQSFLT